MPLNSRVLFSLLTHLEWVIAAEWGKELNHCVPSSKQQVGSRVVTLVCDSRS